MLFENYKFAGGFVDTMQALEVKFDTNFLTRTSAAINTLDLPAIEFVVARNKDTLETADILGKAILANIEFQRKTSFGNTEWKLNLLRVIFPAACGVLWRDERVYTQES